MQFAIEAISNQLGLVIEIPSYVAGVIAFLFAFLLMGIMFFVLKAEKEKKMPSLNLLKPSEIARLENPLSSSEAPYLAIVTLVALGLVFDVLIVVSVLQEMGSVVIGTMLALAAFLAAAILSVYRSAFMSDAFTRKPRLEKITASLLEGPRESETRE